MKNKFLLLVSMLVISSMQAEKPVQRYRAEYLALKQSPDYKLLVDDEAAAPLRDICRDIENYQELTRFQRFVRGAFMSLDAFVVTPRTMPKLYAYIDSMCKAQQMVTPTIFVSTVKGFFNAAAQKLLKSSGAIIIGEKLLLETSDDELEAIVAHEIGHIKYDHVNKMLCLTAIAYVPALYIAKRLSKPVVLNSNGAVASLQRSASLYKKVMIASITANLLTALYVNKRYEKEADEFACKAMGKSKGLVQFFEQLQQKELQAETNLIRTGELLTQNKSKIAKLDYLNLNLRYYLAHAGQRVHDAFSWLYHHTFIGAHPAPEERILVAKGYSNS